ncbi:spoIIIJ-associated protein [Desulfobotulus alkaliphilus]|uniref:RNA-binding protein KhpB n=1 Tax=Desulfobotulus alkaliphilus TaxID=622671 RepID=A0A562S3W1_9BACT|nr:RNA-binding cell elongation regulator Jag/EloR [Desulfobotulus alkaliphilus]TWI75594.1 spoIIIJ-associated protein [Desulfobotulus alkaliphilus]
MNTTVEYEGKSVEDALENASRKLKLSKDKIQYDVISYGSTGIFGLVGVKKAKIRITLSQGKNGTSAESDRKVSASSLVDEAFGAVNGTAQPQEKKSNGGGKPQRSQGKKKQDLRETVKEVRVQPETPASKETLPEEESLSSAAVEVESSGGPLDPPVMEKGSRSRSRSSRSKNSRGNGRKPAASPAPSTKGKKEDAPLPVPVNLPESEGDNFVETEEENPVPVEVTPEMIARGREVLEKILPYISEDVTIREEVSPGRILYNLDGGNPAIIIGKRGQTLEAIQYVVDKIVNRDAEGRVRIQMDVEGYIETRKEHLQQLALKQAEKARRTGKPATIGQMNAHDRRIIHLALKDDRTVRTQSVGEGYYRRLVIFPKKVRRRRSDGNGNEES